MLYSNWEKHALLENLNFIYQGHDFPFWVRKQKVVQLKATKSSISRIVSAVNPRHSGLLINALLFWKYCSPVEIFENCSQCSPISQVSANPSFFFLARFKVVPFFFLKILCFVTYHGHSISFHCGNLPFFPLNLKKNIYFLHKELLILTLFFSQASK